MILIFLAGLLALVAIIYAIITGKPLSEWFPKKPTDPKDPKIA